jgi:hypothetical protein
MRRMKMSDKTKKLSTESKIGDKPQYEAPRIMPLGRTGAAEGGTICTPGSGNFGECLDGFQATMLCSTGNGTI